MIDKTIQKRLKQSCQNDKNVIAAYVFGSYSQNNARSDSDFDLAVVVTNKKDTTDTVIYDLIKHIRFPKDLDLVVVDRQSSPLLLYQIISKGSNLYARSDLDRVYFESFVLHRYYDTAHIRNIYNLYLPKKFNRHAN